jgi:hypothetical protein
MVDGAGDACEAGTSRCREFDSLCSQKPIEPFAGGAMDCEVEVGFGGPPFECDRRVTPTAICAREWSHADHVAGNPPRAARAK